MANGTWRISRRGNAQLPLAIVAALAIALILIGKAQSSLFDRARARVTDLMQPALEVVRAPLAGVDRWIGSIGEIFTVYQENLLLKEENARLRQWRNRAVVLQDRVERYELLLHAVPDPALSSVMARVIGRASRPFLETMILDAGKGQGVKPGQAVVDARGMIGRIFITGDHTAWVILLTDLNSRIPVTIEPGNIQAIMAGDNSAMPVVEIVSQNATIKAGDQVVSSGDGSLLPPGLPVGTVSGDGRTGPFRISLLADAASSQDVEVVDFKHPPENPSAPSQNDLPATAAGLAPAAPPPSPAVTQAPMLQGATPGAPPSPAGASTANAPSAPHANGTTPAPAVAGSPRPVPAAQDALALHPSTKPSGSAPNSVHSTVVPSAPPSGNAGNDDDTNQ